MDSNSHSKPDNTISLAEKVAFSDRFSKLFADGMALVEESAAYLDGEGRQRARQELSRSAMVLFGTESMRLTTRLMQLASWLLLQRAANEGEMTQAQFLEEKKKVKLDTIPASDIDSQWEMLPAEFVDLVNRSLALQTRITSIDAEIYAQPGKRREAGDNPVRQQLDLLSTALGTRYN